MVNFLFGATAVLAFEFVLLIFIWLGGTDK